MDALPSNIVSPSEIADVVRSIHRFPLYSVPVDLAPLAVQTELDALLTYQPALASPVAQIRRLLSKIPTEVARVVVHGDLHLQQFVVGKALHIVDFERSGIGDHRVDLGELLAHGYATDLRATVGGLPDRIHTDFVRRVVDAYAPTGTKGLAPFVATSLVNKALMLSRHFDAQAAPLSERLVDHAIDLLTRPGSRWWNE